MNKSGNKRENKSKEDNMQLQCIIPTYGDTTDNSPVLLSAQPGYASSHAQVNHCQSPSNAQNRHILKKLGKPWDSDELGTASDAVFAPAEFQRIPFHKVYKDHFHDPEFQNSAVSDGEESDPFQTKANKKTNRSNSISAKPSRGRPGAGSGTSKSFPSKLHEMLSDADKENFSDVITWHPHGRSFVIYKRKQFVEEIMPKYFKQTKLPSFQRQLNLYGFSRITTGVDRGGYFHELFLRGRFDLCRKMRRQAVKGLDLNSTQISTEPNFYNMEPCHEGSTMKNSIAGKRSSNNNMAVQTNMKERKELNLQLQNENNIKNDTKMSAAIASKASSLNISGLLGNICTDTPRLDNLFSMSFGKNYNEATIPSNNTTGQSLSQFSAQRSDRNIRTFSQIPNMAQSHFDVALSSTQSPAASNPSTPHQFNTNINTTSQSSSQSSIVPNSSIAPFIGSSAQQQKGSVPDQQQDIFEIQGLPFHDLDFKFLMEDMKKI